MTPLQFAILWIICGIVSGGGMNAYFRRRTRFWNAVEAREDFSAALIPSLLCGPVALVCTLMITGFFASGWTLSWRALP